MSGPAEIWLDARVAKTLPQEPDESGAYDGAEQLRYFSADRVRELMHQAGGSPEFVIQMVPHPQHEDIVIGLSNYGRVFYYEPDSQNWSDPIPGPVIEEAQP